MNITLTMKRFLSIVILLAGMTACNKNDRMETPEPSEKPDITFYALTDDNKIHEVNAGTSNVFTSSVAITGLLSGEKVLSIDFRPATGQLYALSSASLLYILNPETGVATALRPLPFTPRISGMYASIDFNPTVDRIRLVSPSGQNLRLHPETGLVAFTDGMINGADNASIAGVAYTNSMAGASETTLFDIDANSGKLFKQIPPNDGTLVEVGSLGVNFTGISGFDIAASENAALAALTTESGSGLYGINLTTGMATSYGSFPPNSKVISIAIPTMPVAYAVDNQNNLLIFNPANPASVITKPIAGIAANEKIVGIDMRPVNGQLYGLANSGQLYTFNLSNGMAVGVGMPLTIEGTAFGFDFNPTVDRIRIVSDAGINLRVNPNDGSLTMADGMLNPGMPMISAAAYSNNFPGATTTELFDIDASLNKLFKQIPPNDGTLLEIGLLGVDVTETNGFDIGGRSNTAYAILTSGSATAIYSINLSTGTATKLSDFSVGVNAMAIGLGF